MLDTGCWALDKADGPKAPFFGFSSIEHPVSRIFI